VHLPKACVGAAVDRPTVDVVAEQIGLEDEDADVGRGTEVDKLLDLMLEEALVDERDERQLGTC